MPKYYERIVKQYGAKRVGRITALTLALFFALAMYALLRGEVFHSSLLYIFIPYCISVAITAFRSYEEPTTLLKGYFGHLLTASTIFLGSMVLLGEGFVCIAFFLPIYLIVITVTYIGYAIKARRDRGSKFGFVIPVVVLAISMEGTSASLSFERHTYVDVFRTSSLSVDEIKANLARPFTLDKKRHWLISIFPMPYHIDAGSLNAGDVHTVYTRYHRWFIANTHEGQSELLIESVSPNRIRTRVLSDTTYFSTYLNGTGTQIDLTPNAQGGTNIKFRLMYRRNLDPAWYFHPLQKFGVEKMGELIINELMIREAA